MNLKQEAAKRAVTFIHNYSTVGLGAGATIAYMVEYLKEEKLSIQVFTSSAATKELLVQHGFTVNDISTISSLDLYFDGCDQFNKDLNALKSGAGIHTIEKLLASMAKEFIIVGDESKYAEQLTNTFPLVLEVLPQAVCFVIAELTQLYSPITTAIRYDVNNKPVITENGNLLIDVWFEVLPDLAVINSSIKEITGVVETSLFYNMANKAIIAGAEGTRVLEKNNKNGGE